MFKKSLLASIALISLNPVQANQAAPAPSHCPPCPCGGVNGWVLIPAGSGTPCNQAPSSEEQAPPAKPHHHKAQPLEQPMPAPHKLSQAHVSEEQALPITQHHHTGQPLEHSRPAPHKVIQVQHASEEQTPTVMHRHHTVQPVQQSVSTPPHHFDDHSVDHHRAGLKPIKHHEATKEEDDLRRALEGVQGNLYEKANGQVEFGKPYNNGIYFQDLRLGIWVKNEDTPQPKIYNKGSVKARAQAIEQALKSQQQPQQRPTPRTGVTVPAPTSMAPTRPTEPITSAEAPLATTEASAPSKVGNSTTTSSGYTGKRYKVNLPDALSTASRPNTTIRTTTGKPEFAQGTVNQAQTGITGKEAPSIDASSAIPMAPPPPPLPEPK
ncbi:MAG: hypothetical protein K0R76_281 [Alphaproteobacteria bacterium]|nr:hypothetical protein [Alphaproteobacteria bacterium]